MSSEPDRNPSPPPEILDLEEFSSDRIGDTMYSKRWTIKTLMSIIEACDKTKETSENSVQNADMLNEAVEDVADVVELDPKIEEDVCTLWDMSASKQVAKFLFDSSICEIFRDVVEKTKSPRLLEIVVGILGNMSTFDDLCQNISNNKSLVYTVLLLSGTTDTPSLIQVFRLIDGGLKNEKCQNLWYEAFEENPFFMDNMKDILLNSLNGTVIVTTYQLLFTILTQNIYYCEVWGQEPFLESVLVAGQQLFKTDVCLDDFFCVFNSLCQYTPNVKIFVEKWDELKSLFYEYVDSLGKEECLFDSERVPAICSYFDAYNTLLNSGLMKNSVLADTNYLISVARVSGEVNNLISNIKKNNQKLVDLQRPDIEEPDNFLRRVDKRNGEELITFMTQYEFHTWNRLAESIIDLIKTLQNFVKREDEKEILADILNFGISQENIGVLII